MIKNKKNNIIGAIVLIICFILIIGVAFFFHIRHKNRFINEPTCTTKTIELEFSSDADGIETVIFKIKVNKQIYEGTYWLQDMDKSIIKDTMIIRYLCNNPEENEMIVNK